MQYLLNKYFSSGKRTWPVQVSGEMLMTWRLCLLVPYIWCKCRYIILQQPFQDVGPVF